MFLVRCGAISSQHRRFLAAGSSLSPPRSNAWQQLSDLFRGGRLREMNAVFAACANEAGKGVYKLMLQKARQEKDPEEAKRVFELLVARDETPDEAMFHFLIDTLLDTGRVQEAMAYLGLEAQFGQDDAAATKRSVSSTLLLTLPRSSVIGSLVARIISERAPEETAAAHVERVERVLAEAQNRGIRLSGSVWAAVMRVRIQCDEKTPVLDLVKATLQAAAKSGTPVDPSLLEAGMNCLVSSGSRELAWWLYENFGTEALGNADLSRRAAHRLLVVVLKCSPSFGAAKQAMSKFVQLGFRPDAFSYHCLLLSLCRDSHEVDRVRLAGKCVLEPLKERRLQPFEHTATAMAALRVVEENLPWKVALGSAATSQRAVGGLMELLLQMGRRETVLQIWDEGFCGPAPLVHDQPGEKVFLAAVRACLARLPRGNSLLDPRYESVLSRLRSSSLKPSEELLAAALRTEGLGGKVERAVSTFEALLKGQLGDLRASRSIVRAMVETLGHNQNGAQLVPVLLELASKSYNIPIDIDLYNLWISACRFGAQDPPTPEDVLRLYHTIKNKGVTPNAVTYNSLFALMDQVPHNLDVTRHVHYLLHDWWRISEHAGKDSVTNNLLLRVLGSRETAQSRLICHRIFAFMNASSDPAQWPDGYTYHALVKGLVRSGQFRRAVQTMQEAVEKTEQRRRESGKQAEGPWRHTVEYLMGNLLGEGKMDLAERLREIMAKHGFVMGCPLPNIEDDD